MGSRPAWRNSCWSCADASRIASQVPQLTDSTRPALGVAHVPPWRRGRRWRRRSGPGPRRPAAPSSMRTAPGSPCPGTAPDRSSTRVPSILAAARRRSGGRVSRSIGAALRAAASVEDAAQRRRLARHARRATSARSRRRPRRPAARRPGRRGLESRAPPASCISGRRPTQRDVSRALLGQPARDDQAEPAEAAGDQVGGIAAQAQRRRRSAAPPRSDGRPGAGHRADRDLVLAVVGIAGRRTGSRRASPHRPAAGRSRPPQRAGCSSAKTRPTPHSGACHRQTAAGSPSTAAGPLRDQPGAARQGARESRPPGAAIGSAPPAWCRGRCRRNRGRRSPRRRRRGRRDRRHSSASGNDAAASSPAPQNHRVAAGLQMPLQFGHHRLGTADQGPAPRPDAARGPRPAPADRGRDRPRRPRGPRRRRRSRARRAAVSTPRDRSAGSRAAASVSVKRHQPSVRPKLRSTQRSWRHAFEQQQLSPGRQQAAGMRAGPAAGRRWHAARWPR